MATMPDHAQRTLLQLLTDSNQMRTRRNELKHELDALEGRLAANEQARVGLEKYYDVGTPKDADPPDRQMTALEMEQATRRRRVQQIEAGRAARAQAELAAMIEGQDDDTRETEVGRLTTYDAVVRVLQEDPARAFSPGEVVEAVMSRGLPVALEDPPAAIRVALRRTVDRGDGRRTEHAGRGFLYSAARSGHGPSIAHTGTGVVHVS